jgi:hypothetical protein
MKDLSANLFLVYKRDADVLPNTGDDDDDQSMSACIMPAVSQGRVSTASCCRLCVPCLDYSYV